MNKLVCLAVLVLAVAHACLGASEFKFPDTVMSTIDVGCNPLVDFFDCMPFLETFKWPLTSLRVEGPVTILQKPEVALKDASTSYVIFNVNNSANWSVVIEYAPGPDQPGFTLRAGFEESADGSERDDYITANLGARHFGLITPFGPVALPCPGSPASAQCLMHYFPIMLHYTGNTTRSG